MCVAGIVGLGACVAPASWSPGAVSTEVVNDVRSFDLARPRIELRSADVDVVQQRLNRAPYNTLFARADAQIAAAPAPSATDQVDCGLTVNIGREEAKARAAKNLAFMYLVNRVWDSASQTVVTPDASTRQRIGDAARDYLVHSCITSRIHIQPDRDINTANELTQMATAYDTLAGSDYDFGASQGTIVANLVAWTAEFYSDYQPFANYLTNNHGAKTAAAIGTAAIAIAGEPGTDASQLNTWMAFAMNTVQHIVRHTMGSTDGGYGEGPFYWRYASQNVVPFARAYHAVALGAAWANADGSSVADIWSASWFRSLGRWELDMTRPDGTLVPIDDGNVDDAYYFGLLPSDDRDAAAFAWRWVNAGTSIGSSQYESGGNVDLSTDQIVTYDDSIRPAPPTGSPNRLRGASGTLVFRSSWDREAVAVFVQAERRGARGFGTPPGKPGTPWAAVHDHADPGSFQLDAYGERLLLDPGYVNYTWTLHGTFADPSAHNMVLVGPPTDPQSPGSPNAATTMPSAALDAFTTVAGAPVPVDGEARVTDVVERRGITAATVVSRYGRDPQYIAPTPLSAFDYLESESPQNARVQRRFLMIDKRYMVIADAVSSEDPRWFSWPLHGNGGGTDGKTDPRPRLALVERSFESAAAIPATRYSASGGTFKQFADGGEWERPAARVTTAMAFDNGVSPTLTTTQGLYEQTHGKLGSNTVLTTAMHVAEARAASVIYPTRTSGAAPVVTRLNVSGAAVLRVHDAANDHEVLIIVQAPGRGAQTFLRSITGMPVDVRTDATIAVVDVRSDGRRSFHYQEGATVFAVT